MFVIRFNLYARGEKYVEFYGHDITERIETLNVEVDYSTGLPVVTVILYETPTDFTLDLKQGSTSAG